MNIHSKPSHSRHNGVRCSNTSVTYMMDILLYFCDRCRVCREHGELFFVEPLSHVSWWIALILLTGRPALRFSRVSINRCCNEAFSSMDFNYLINCRLLRSRNNHLKFLIHDLLLPQNNFYQKLHPGHYSARTILLGTYYVNCSVNENVREKLENRLEKNLDDYEWYSYTYHDCLDTKERNS